MSGIQTRSYSSSLPAGVEELWVDSVSGSRVGERCEGAVRLPFLEGTAPDYGDCGKTSFGKKAARWFKGIFNGDKG
jgi:penicillin-binding protein 1B